jgi:hypothetical protein
MRPHSYHGQTGEVRWARGVKRDDREIFITNGSDEFFRVRYPSLFVNSHVEN